MSERQLVDGTLSTTLRAGKETEGPAMAATLPRYHQSLYRMFLLAMLCIHAILE